MASIALGGVGAVVGSFFGQWQLGWSLGTVVGGLLFPPRNGSQIGNVRNLSVQLSAYGAPIPRVWGAMRIAGNVVWALPLQVSKHSSKSGPTTYTYYANCAVLLCPGVISSISRIWANDLLIYDVSQSPHTKATIRIYTGTNTQNPDTLIEANLGVGTTPAYRDMAYVVFEHFDLTAFGNALPQFSFEVQVGSNPSIADIVSDVCVSCGLSTGQLDVSAVTDTVTGFQVPQRTQGNAALQDLLTVYGVDLVEVDGKLVLVKRGQSSVVTIPESDLGAYSSNKTETRLDVRRVQDAEIPVQVDLAYLSQAVNYQQMTQHALRQTKPATRDALTINLPAVLTDDFARQAAERLLYTGWREREQFRIVVGPKYMYLSPGDIVTLPQQGSYDKRLRLDNVDTSLPGEIALTCVLDELQVLSQGITSPTVSVTDPEFTGSVPTTFLAFAGPELFDTDGFSTGFYVVAGPTGNAAPWTGATIYYSSDGGTSWFSAGQVTQAGAVGVTTSTLASYLSANPDTTHTVGVNLATGTLDPASQPEVDAGANQALVGGEVLGFTTATLTSANHYTLSTLTRAERSTVTTGHSTGEAFAMLGNQVRATVPDALAGSTILVKVVGTDETLAGVTAQSITLATKTGGPVPQPGSGGTTDIASSGSDGTDPDYSRRDHTHRGVHKITFSGDAYGDITFSGAVVQTGNNFAFGGSSLETLTEYTDPLFALSPIVLTPGTHNVLSNAHSVVFELPAAAANHGKIIVACTRTGSAVSLTAANGTDTIESSTGRNNVWYQSNGVDTWRNILSSNNP